MNERLIGPFLFPVFTLVGILAAWLYYASRVLWPLKPLAESRVYRCQSCGHVYVDARDIPMARCPQCDQFNEAVKR
jgi:hypothetical protein